MTFTVDEVAEELEVLPPVQTRDEAIAAIRETCAKYEFVRCAALFGSFSRNEQTDKSDVDVLAQLASDVRLADFCDLGYELVQVLGRNVDLVSSMYGASRMFFESVVRDGIIAYGDVEGANVKVVTNDDFVAHSVKFMEEYDDAFRALANID